MSKQPESLNTIPKQARLFTDKAATACLRKSRGNICAQEWMGFLGSPGRPSITNSTWQLHSAERVKCRIALRSMFLAVTSSPLRVQSKGKVLQKQTCSCPPECTYSIGTYLVNGASVCRKAASLTTSRFLRGYNQREADRTTGRSKTPNRSQVVITSHQLSIRKTNIPHRQNVDSQERFQNFAMDLICNSIFLMIVV